MKSIYKIALITSLIMLIGCSDNFLSENPKSFLSPTTSYKTDKGLASGAVGLYDQLVYPYYSSGKSYDWWAISNGATDFFQMGYSVKNREINTLNSEYNGANADGPLSDMWYYLYKLANNASTLLYYSDKHTWKDNALKERSEGEAHFFRGWAQLYLTLLWGNVPIVKGKTELNKDYTRQPQEKVLQFAAEDFSNAVDLLPEKPEQPGRIDKTAAKHMLAYAYLSLKDYKKAEKWAQSAIDDPNHSLVTQRFGSGLDNPDGNVFWDLFQLDNQNNNPEGLLVLQNGNTEKFPQYGPSDYGYAADIRFPRVLYARYEKINELQNSKKYGGRGFGVNNPTMAWENLFDPNDIRGQEPCRQTIWVANQESEQAAIGDTIFVFGKPEKSIYPQDDIRLRPYPTKWNWDGILTYMGATTRDIYLIRLSATYLVLAEAQLMQGERTLAAKNINKVRSRAHASLIDASDVTLDFILDERGRELWGEQYSRKADLFRTGKYVERVKKYNPQAGPNVQKKDTLLPIPNSELNQNSNWSQNPGF